MDKLKKISIENYINYLLVLYAFVVPISRAGISILTALIFILWLFTDNFKFCLKKFKSNKIVLYLLLYMCFAILSLLWTDDVRSGLDYIRRYWYFLPILVMASTLKKEYMTYAISAFLTGMFISEILSYGMFFELWSLKHGSPTDPTPFMNHLQYSMFLSFAALLLLNKFFFEENLKWKIFYFAYFLLVTSNLFLNGGRTGQFAFAISIFIVGFLNIKSKLVAFFSMLILLTSIFYVAYQVSPVFKHRFDASVKETKIIGAEKIFCGSFGQRLGAWIVGGEIFLDNPLLGVGISKNTDTLKEYIDRDYPNMKCVKSMVNYHNYYIQVLVKLGVIGLFLYLMIFYNIFKLNLKDRQYYNLMIIFIVVYSTSSLFENMFHQQFSAALFTLFTGIFIAQKRIEHET
ncbi:MAG: O-antigen ligase family protein [Sulfurimonas sp.]|nr:O-antigen ligase family protein [Sulfurimonas sp.]